MYPRFIVEMFLLEYESMRCCPKSRTLLSERGRKDEELYHFVSLTRLTLKLILTLRVLADLENKGQSCLSVIT